MLDGDHVFYQASQLTVAERSGVMRRRGGPHRLWTAGVDGFIVRKFHLNDPYPAHSMSAIATDIHEAIRPNRGGCTAARVDPDEGAGAEADPEQFVAVLSKYHNGECTSGCGVNRCSRMKAARHLDLNWPLPR